MRDTSCLNCLHLNPDNIFTCEAYPDGIPDEILSGSVDHFTALEGDNGFHWKEGDVFVAVLAEEEEND